MDCLKWFTMPLVISGMVSTWRNFNKRSWQATPIKLKERQIDCTRGLRILGLAYVGRALALSASCFELAIGSIIEGNSKEVLSSALSNFCKKETEIFWCLYVDFPMPSPFRKCHIPPTQLIFGKNESAGSFHFICLAALFDSISQRDAFFLFRCHLAP